VNENKVIKIIAVGNFTNNDIPIKTPAANELINEKTNSAGFTLKLARLMHSIPTAAFKLIALSVL
jgi:hypothetical protein